MKELTKRDVTEYLLLASLLNDTPDGEAWKKVEGFVTEDMWKYGGHKTIFKAIETLRQHGCTASPLDVMSILISDVGDTRVSEKTKLAAYMVDISIRFFTSQDPYTGNFVTVDELVTDLASYTTSNGYTSI